MKSAVFALFLLLSGCGGVKVGPFLPDNPHPCRSDLDCGELEVCNFPGVDRPPICMPANEGENESFPNGARGRESAP